MRRYRLVFASLAFASAFIFAMGAAEARRICPIFCSANKTAQFTPANLANIKFWWDGADSSTMTFGTGVASWTDKISGLVASQATTALQPSFAASGLNGKSILTATSNQFLQTTPVSLSLNTPTVSVFMVIKNTSGANGRGFDYANGGSDVSAGAFIAVFFPSLTNAASFMVATKSNGTIVSSSWNQLGSIFDGTNNTFYIANVAQAPVGSTGTFLNGGVITMFANPAGGNGMAGSIAEIIVTNGVMSASDRSKLATYFTAKWGI